MKLPTPRPDCCEGFCWGTSWRSYSWYDFDHHQGRRRVRDRLKEQARAHGRTLGEHLEALVEAEARRDRLRAMAAAMTATPPDQEYRADAEAWASDVWR